MNLIHTTAWSIAILMGTLSQVQAAAVCKPNPYANTTNDGKDYFIVMPNNSQMQVVKYPPDIASYPIGKVFGYIYIRPYVINKRFTHLENSSILQCSGHQSYGWFGVGTFHQQYRAYASSIPGVGLRIDIGNTTVPSNPIQAGSVSNIGIPEASTSNINSIIKIALVKIGPITQTGTLSGVFLQLKFDDVVGAQYQFNREATVPTGPTCTVGYNDQDLNAPAGSYPSIHLASVDTMAGPTAVASVPARMEDDLPMGRSHPLLSLNDDQTSDSLHERWMAGVSVTR